MTYEEKKATINRLLDLFEKEMKDEDFLDVLAFISVLIMYEKRHKNPYRMFDTLLHYWVKTISTLSGTFILETPSSDLPQA